MLLEYFQSNIDGNKERVEETLYVRNINNKQSYWPKMRLFEDFYAPMDWNWVWIDCQVWQDCAREQFSMSVGQYQYSWNKTGTLIFAEKTVGWAPKISFSSFPFNSKWFFGINHIRFPISKPLLPFYLKLILHQILSASEMRNPSSQQPINLVRIIIIWRSLVVQVLGVKA